MMNTFISGERQYDFVSKFNYVREAGTCGEQRAAETILQELKKAGVDKMAASPCYEVLRQYDETHNGDLCYIFMQFLKNGRNVNQTSTAIFQHRNTVLNKVKKAVSIMQNECEDYQSRIAFMLSYLNDPNR